MSRRTLKTVKVIAIGYAVKVALLAGLWMAAPELVRQGRDKALAAWNEVVD